MVHASEASNRDRIKSAIGVAGFHALLGYVLIVGLGFEPVRLVSGTLKVFDVAAPPPPPPIEDEAAAEEGAAAPPNLAADPAPVVVPPPAIPLPVPPPIAAAPVARAGSDSNAGASTRVGPGTGAGGAGSGTGSGASGFGTGAGGTRARLAAGRITNADYPRAARRAGAGGVVQVRLNVAADGRVTACAIEGSSGNADLDATTCRLILRRFRFDPARDASGAAVADVMLGTHSWWTRPRRERPF